MLSVRHVIELHKNDAAITVEFIRDTNGQWHADVYLPDGSRWAFRQDNFGPFHPCDLQAERLTWIAIGMVNSMRPA